MTVTRYKHPEDSGRVAMSAVAVVSMDGFLAESAPLARLFAGRDPRAKDAYLLLSLEQRRKLEGATAEQVRWRYEERQSGLTVEFRAGKPVFCVFNIWTNASNVWVSVRDLVQLLAINPPEEQTHGQGLMRALVAEAARVAKVGA